MVLETNSTIQIIEMINLVNPMMKILPWILSIAIGFQIIRIFMPSSNINNIRVGDDIKVAYKKNRNIKYNDNYRHLGNKKRKKQI